MKTGIILAVVLVLAFVVSGCVTTTGTGKLVLQITDKPALNIEKAEVTISNVQVHTAETGNESGWFTVVDGPQTFDLVAIKDVKEYLGEKELAAGIYTQIRLDVDSAKVTINGTEHNLTISSKNVKLVRSFEIAEGETTTLTLDFDAEESVHEANGRYTMRPTIKVLGPSPGKTEKEQACEDSGGTVTTGLCCESVGDFPNLCLIGPCGCAPDNSHDVRICDCGEGNCFDGDECVPMVNSFGECVDAGYPVMESYPRRCINPPNDRTFTEGEETCVASGGEDMSLFDAMEIAKNSECVVNGTLKDPYYDFSMCNADTGTWWIDLDIEREGCSPACVVDIAEGTSEINWRCTGVV